MDIPEKPNRSRRVEVTPSFCRMPRTATQYANLIKRDPVTGQIISISQTNANLFKSNVSGLDSDMRYRFDVTDTDRLTLLANGTYFYRYVSQNPDGSWTADLDKGLTAVGGVISRFRGSSTLEFEHNSLFRMSTDRQFPEALSRLRPATSRARRATSPPMKHWMPRRLILDCRTSPSRSAASIY